jgi:CheY-like chemotaxis protein
MPKLMNKILVIEDEPETRNLFVEALTEEGYKTMGAENGRVGLDKAQTYLPDLIICDLIIPELNGYQVLLALRNNFITAMIPLIFLTANTDESEKERAMILGVNDYLTKPCTVEKLLRAIAKFI